MRRGTSARPKEQEQECLENKPKLNFDLGLPTPELWDNAFLLLESPTLWYFVTASSPNAFILYQHSCDCQEGWWDCVCYAFHSREEHFFPFLHSLSSSMYLFIQPTFIGQLSCAKKLGLQKTGFCLHEWAFELGEWIRKGLCKPINIDMSTVTRSVRLNHLSWHWSIFDL